MPAALRVDIDSNKQLEGKIKRPWLYKRKSSGYFYNGAGSLMQKVLTGSEDLHGRRSWLPRWSNTTPALHLWSNLQILPEITPQQYVTFQLEASFKTRLISHTSALFVELIRWAKSCWMLGKKRIWWNSRRVKYTRHMNVTTSTEMKSTAVSNNSKFRSKVTPMGQPRITQTGICIKCKNIDFERSFKWVLKVDFRSYTYSTSFEQGYIVLPQAWRFGWRNRLPQPRRGPGHATQATG